MIKSIFTKPKLCKSKRGWYVHFRYNGRQKRYSFDLNNIENLKERQKEFDLLIEVLSEKLQNGWNPFCELDPNDQLLFTDALTFALEHKKDKVAKKTYLGYKGTIGFIKEAISKNAMDYLLIKEVKRKHIRLIMNRAKEMRKWSNKAYNKNLNYLKAVLSELIDWDVIETNPAHKIKNLPVNESRANVPATPEQAKLIKKELFKTDPYFNNFIAVLYHTGIRPKEILSIKIEMIDLENSLISLPATITKTKIERIVPINYHLSKLLDAMDIHIYPKDFYLFGSFREKGKGNVGKHLDFICGPTPIKRDTATKRWKRLIKDKLNINVNMYSEKHRGANDKIMAGIDLDALRELYGHKSKMMTMRYAKAVKDVYRNSIIDKSPEY